MANRLVQKLGKEYVKSVYCHPAYLTYMQNTMQNARLDESQTGITIAGSKTNKLRHANDTTLIVEIKEELKSHLMRVKKESEKSWLKIQH